MTLTNHNALIASIKTLKDANPEYYVQIALGKAMANLAAGFRTTEAANTTSEIPPATSGSVDSRKFVALNASTGVVTSPFAPTDQ